MKRVAAAAGFAFLFALLLSHTAQAQAFRTWVSNGGDDMNPCSTTSPCRTFAGAIAKTAAGGIISVLNTGGYGSITITKSISIVAEGVQASILTSTNGITINAGQTDVVYLRGIFIQAQTVANQPPPSNGILINSAGAVHINKCDIQGFSGGNAIQITSTGATEVLVSDCTIALNAAGIAATGQGQNEIFVNRAQLFRNQTAIVGKNTTTIFHLNASVLANNAIAIGQVDGRILSSQNNALIGNDSDGQGMGAEPLK
jgi:hypothetical protein